jgi:hypothetical protein
MLLASAIDVISESTATIGSLATITVIMVKLILASIKNQTKDTIKPGFDDIDHRLEHINERIARMEGELQILRNNRSSP